MAQAKAIMNKTSRVVAFEAKVQEKARGWASVTPGCARHSRRRRHGHGV